MSRKVNVNVNATPLIAAAGVLAVVVVIVIVIAIIKAVRNAKDNSYLRENKKVITKADLTYSEADYTVFANKLYAAMKGLGTDEDAVFSVFQLMQTESDVRMLINAFGSKKGETLSQWLLGDLSTADIAKINGILAYNGINYRF